MLLNSQIRWIAVGLLCYLLSAGWVFASEQIKPRKVWNGSVSDEALMTDAPEQIGGAEEFEKLWKEWKLPGRVPNLDFSNQFIVVVTTRGSQLKLIANLDDQGNLTTAGMGTRDLRPGFRFVFALINREKIKTVNGKQLSSAPGPESAPRPEPVVKTPEPEPGKVTGTVTYRQRIALPPDAVVEVSLIDVSRADAPAIVLDRQSIKPTGQVPIPFVLSYDPGSIKPTNTYAVQAKIIAEGKLWFMSAHRYAVITQGAPTRIEVVVGQVQ